MADLKITTNVHVMCNECARDLKAWVDYRKEDNLPMISVEPCQTCIEENQNIK